MKTIFICSSLEPGNDGVGDYTRKLACALINCGHKAAIIAINDRRLNADVWQGKQTDNDTETEVLRLSTELPWRKRLGKAKAFAIAFDADWISLQYVPFGFHLKGLPFNLGNKLKQLETRQRWHIMFHELSVNKNDSIKFKLWSFLQMRIIQSFLKLLRPALITTNTELYRLRLKELGYSSKLLPLFSNINRVSPAPEPFYDIIPEFLLKNRKNYLIGTLFGSFDFKRWDIRSLLNKFSGDYCKNGKKPVIASIGKMPYGITCWQTLQHEYPSIIFLTFGMQDAGFISYWLSAYTDFGILTTLPELAGKSGSFMAYKEHGLPVVCKERTPGLAATSKTKLDKALTVIDDKTTFTLPPKYAPVAMLNEVVNQFINELSSDKSSK